VSSDRASADRDAPTGDRPPLDANAGASRADSAGRRRYRRRPAGASGRGAHNRGLLRLKLHPPPPRVAVLGAAAFAVACALLVVLAGRAVRAAMLVGLLSLFLAYLVAPVSRHLRRVAHRRGRILSPASALALVYGAVGAGLLLVRLSIGERLLAQVHRFTDSVPGHVDEALRRTSSLARWQEWFGLSGVSTTTLGGLALSLSDWVRLHVADILLDALDYRWVLPWLGLVPVLSFLLLTNFGMFRRSTLRVLPAGHLRWRGSEFLAQVNSVLAGYTRAQVLSSLIVGTIMSVGLAILKVPYALLVGVAAGFLEFLPLVGPVAAALLAAGLVRGGRLVAVIVFIALVRIVQDTVIYPRLMGRRMHLPAPAVLLAIWLGAALGGILGVLLALPIVGVGAVAVRQWRDYRAVEALVRAHREDAPPRE
jgi:predicted PurR-regulated permease PerM